MKLEQIKKEGFLLSEVFSKREDVTLVSLRIALRAYFNTYKAINYRAEPTLDGRLRSDEDTRSFYTVSYVEYASEAILHFHHFVELTIKAILRKKHSLLAIDVGSQHATMYDLLTGKDVNEGEIQKAKSIEFSIALQRLLAIISHDSEWRPEIKFFTEAREFLESLNLLRNRLLHRGSFILKYAALDELFGRYALPLMLRILPLDEENKKNLLLVKSNFKNIDVVSEIIEVFKAGYDAMKIGVLKEIGRASYESPLHFPSDAKGIYATLNAAPRKMAASAAKHLAEIKYHDLIRTCPVCGTASLLIMDDVILDGDMENNFMTPYVYKIQCTCCTFELGTESYDIANMNLGLEDFYQL